MKKNDFYVFLESLHPKETKRFGEFLSSQYFNRSLKITEVFGFIRSRIEELNKGKAGIIESCPSNKEIYEHLYPGKKYSDVIIRNHLSNLVKLGMDFLLYESFRDSKPDHLRYLLTSLNNKGLSKFFKKHSSKPVQAENGFLDYNFFLNNHYTESIRFNFKYLNERFTNKQKTIDSIGHLNNSVESLVYFFIMELSSKYEVAVMYDRLFGLGKTNVALQSFFESNAIESLRALIPVKSKYYFVIELYRSSLKMKTDLVNTKHYYNARNILFDNINLFSKSEKHFFFLSFISYLIRQISAGIKSKIFEKELFEIYKILLDKGYYLHSNANVLSQLSYRNILFHGLRLKEYRWVEDYIRNFTHKLNPKFVKNMRSYANAYLAYHTQNYDEALEYLNEIKADQFQYKYDIKNLTLMIYYEQGCIEETFYAIKSYRGFIKYDGLLSNAKKKKYLKFAAYIEKLLYYTTGKRNLDLDYVNHQISNNDNSAHKEWLLERIRILKRRAK